jgi:hypothetical protein
MEQILAIVTDAVAEGRLAFHPKVRGLLLRRSCSCAAALVQALCTAPRRDVRWASDSVASGLTPWPPPPPPTHPPTAGLLRLPQGSGGGVCPLHKAVGAWAPLLLLCCALALPCPALPCPALPCPALPCPALPCPALPCPVLLYSAACRSLHTTPACCPAGPAATWCAPPPPGAPNRPRCRAHTPRPRPAAPAPSPAAPPAPSSLRYGEQRLPKYLAYFEKLLERDQQGVNSGFLVRGASCRHLPPRRACPQPAAAARRKRPPGARARDAG